MPDIVDSSTRSRMMSRIPGKDTRPELLVRRYLHRHGFRYRLHSKNLPGKPDLVLPKYGAVVLVHGCFWHRHAGCRLAYEPKSRQEFWAAKFARNVERDHEVRNMLADAEWRAIVIWECGLRIEGARTRLLQDLAEWIQSDRPAEELPPTPN